jgi:CubicO group peptidase (beta-lactamase class C family)
MILSLLLPIVSAAPPPVTAADSALARVVAHVRALIDEQRRVEGTPGIVIALIDREGILAVPISGVADLQSAAPLTADSRFLAGSLSKAFTAVALLQLEEEGAIDLRRPVTDYLPWFRVRSSFAPITLHHLLTHTAGLPRDRSDLPASPYTAVSLRDRTVGAAPGARFAYSNIGYQLLSLVMEEVEGRPFPDIVRSRVLVPLGMSATTPSVTQAARLTTVTGYQYLYDDRPPLPGSPLVPAAWSEYSAGDANIVTSVGDLALFLRMLLNQGAAANGRVIRSASFARMVQRTVRAPELGTDMYYGYGLVLGAIEGDPVLWHSGGMPGYRAMMIGDLDEGVGVVVLMNGPGNARRLGEYALRALIALRRGRAPPPVEVSAPPEVVPNASEYAGRFTDSTGAVLLLQPEGAGLALVQGSRRTRLLRQGPDAFMALDSSWSLFPIRFRRQGDQVTELCHGARWFTTEGYRGPRRFSFPGNWTAFVGHYRAQVPYDSNYRVVVRKGQLLFISPDGVEQQLMPVGDQEFRVGGDVETAERVRFEDVVSGRALRMNFSGTDYYRSTSP